MPKIVFVNKDGSKTEVNAKNGQTILDVAQDNNITDLIGACNGSCACGTCHVYIDEETLKKIEQPKEEEENVLDVVFDVKQNSRLACQVVVNDKMNNAVITIPE